MAWRLFWCCGCLIAGTASAATLPFSVEASSYIVQIDDQTRWEQDSTRRLSPASLTKLMTVLLVLLEHYDAQQVVTVSVAAAHETGMRLGLHAGERMQVRDLLAASLLNSANDACHALADHVAGDQRQFVRLMNRRARDWQLRSTHFTNACGHDDPQHYSSARDMTALAHRAMQHPELMELMAMRRMSVASADGTRQFQLTNRNALIGRYDGAVGMKTGYTPKAGKCLVALARRDGVSVLLVMLHAANRWWDASDMLDYAFAQAGHG